ncbi:hypothetical protein NDU88_004739 [Pleurodeles waltl]|uniref:Uncharacterized protein n=1 Tax=Pleurodeles waltl TaxID=8319 RepID=A0AAV7QFN3_PLEWA|nr:hypothetical protein NDU88_004739 [Pleurodeles waltl]
MTDYAQGTTIHSILHEISAVGRRLEGMDSMMDSLVEETKPLDIAGFQSQVTSLGQWVTTVEAQAVFAQIETKSSCISAVSSLTWRTGVAGTMSSFLDTQKRRRSRRPVLPEGDLTQAHWSDFRPPPLEFRRAHRLGPKWLDGDNRPRPITACLLRQTQARQKARTHGPFRMNKQRIRMNADFSKETSECRKAFLAL